MSEINKKQIDLFDFAQEVTTKLTRYIAVPAMPYLFVDSANGHLSSIAKLEFSENADDIIIELRKDFRIVQNAAYERAAHICKVNGQHDLAKTILSYKHRIPNE